MSALPEELRLSTTWELWVVEHLLFTAHRDGIVAELVRQGLDEPTAAAQVARLEADPGYAALRDRLGEARLSQRLEQLRAAVAIAGPVPILDDLAPDELLERFWIPGRPVLLQRTARDIPAVRRWSLASLSERFGHVPVEVSVDRDTAATPAETELRSARLPLADIVAAALGPASNAVYAVSRNGWLADPALRPLWDDLAPLPPVLAPVAFPRGVSLWLGPAGTRTPPHFDPHNVLLVQVEGGKQVRLAPRVRARDHRRLDGWYLRGSLEDAFGDEVRTVALAAGEALFVPAGWFHEVTATSPSLTLSFVSFPWPNHFHFLGPTGAADR